MTDNLMIFIVKPIKYHLVDDVLAYFDTKPKAEKFVERFGKGSPLEIQERLLNPVYPDHGTFQVYLVILGKHSDQPYENYTCPAMQESGYLMQEGYTIEVCLVEGKPFGIFEINLLASSREEALSKALRIRDKAVLKGEWDLAEAEIGKKKQFKNV